MKLLDDPMANIQMHGTSYRLDITRGGVREKINLNTDDPAEAIVRKREILALPPAGPKGNLLADTKRYVTDKVANGIFSRGSARVNKDMLTEFANATGGMTAEVRLDDLTGHYRTLQARVVEATAQIHMRAIGAFFTWAVDQKPPLCATHPGRVKLGDGIVKPAFKLKKIPNKARERFCTKCERDQLITHAPNDDLKFILLCGFLCGMRKNEIIEARVNWFFLPPIIDVDATVKRGADQTTAGAERVPEHTPEERLAALQAMLTLGIKVNPTDPRLFSPTDTGSVHIQNTESFRIKGDGKAHFVPLVPRFTEFLRTYLDGKDRDGWALKPDTKHGKGIYRYDFERPFKDYLAGEQLRWVTAHTMRHTFASLAAQKNVNIHKIARWLGDGVQTTIDHYAHLSPQDRDLEKVE